MISQLMTSQRNAELELALLDKVMNDPSSYSSVPEVAEGQREKHLEQATQLSLHIDSLKAQIQRAIEQEDIMDNYIEVDIERTISKQENIWTQNDEL